MLYKQSTISSAIVIYICPNIIFPTAISTLNQFLKVCRHQLEYESFRTRSHVSHKDDMKLNKLRLFSFLDGSWFRLQPNCCWNTISIYIQENQRKNTSTHIQYTQNLKNRMTYDFADKSKLIEIKQ